MLQTLFTSELKSNRTRKSLAIGNLTLVGGIGSGQTVTGLAAVSDVPEPGSLSLLMMGAAAVLVTRRKR